MRRYKQLLIFYLLILVPLLSFGEKFKANFNYLIFSVPNETSYVEFQFLFHGDGLAYAQTAQNTYQATIQADITFENSDTLIVRNYTFKGNEYADNLSEGKSNVYNVVRIPLPDGKYDVDILLYDKNASNEGTIRHKDKMTINFQNSNLVKISDILPIGFFKKAEQEDNFTRHGVEYMPYLSNFYPENIDRLTFMAEIYNTEIISVGKDFMIHSYIARQNDNTPIGSQYEKWETAKKSDMHVIFQNFDIANLPSGNYELKIEVRDRKEVLHADASWFFQRSNPSASDIPRMRTDSLPYDTMKMYLDYIYIIATNAEREFIDHISPQKYNEIEAFFTDFWKARNPEHPQQEWHNYYAQVMRVNNNYSTLKIKGYRTDRGYYYLKYGPPSDIEYEHSAVNGPPYEIWTYHVMPDGQINIIFVFYNVDLVTRDFKLLHSTARGEVSNPKWKEILHIKEGIDSGTIEMFKDE